VRVGGGVNTAMRSGRGTNWFKWERVKRRVGLKGDGN